jgi:hypothetical protein
VFAGLDPFGLDQLRGDSASFRRSGQQRPRRGQRHDERQERQLVDQQRGRAAPPQHGGMPGPERCRRRLARRDSRSRHSVPPRRPPSTDQRRPRLAGNRLHRRSVRRTEPLGFPTRERTPWVTSPRNR